MMDRYKERLNLYGTNQRERNINRFKKMISSKILENPSYKTVKINGEDANLIINSGTQPYYKEFETLPNQQINIGDYIEWADSYWLVVSCDYDDEIYKDGKIEQCNCLLKWQNENGEIIERWAVVLSASKYNDGTSHNNVITLGSDQLLVKIPIDEESLKLKKSMGKRFFIDNNFGDPTAYELTNTGNVPDTYNGHGVTSWIVKECAYTPTIEDLMYGVCDYFSLDDQPNIPPTFDEFTNLIVSIEGKKELKIGFSRFYAVSFVDQDGNEVKNIDFKWNVISDFEVKQSIEDKKIRLQVDDDRFVGKSFILQVIIDDTIVSENTISVVDGF